MQFNRDTPDRPETARPDGPGGQDTRGGEGTDSTGSRNSVLEEPAQRPVESIIGPHATFHGHFETDQDMRVIGKISGQVVCHGQFTIDPEGFVQTDVDAHDAIIRGRLEGDIICSGRLLIGSTGVMLGSMRSATLVIEKGARVLGDVEAGRRPTRLTPPTNSPQMDVSRERPSSEPALK